MDNKNWAAFEAEYLSRMNTEGMFLTSEFGGRANSMTICWGSAGVFWGKPVLTVAVRPSRYTYEFIEKSGVFTVSIPKKGEMSKALALFGTKSGRDMDKFAACGLTAKPGRKVPAPIIGEAWMHIECRVLTKLETQEASYDAKIVKQNYGDNSFHSFFFGEVVDFYEL